MKPSERIRQLQAQVIEQRFAVPPTDPAVQALVAHAALRDYLDEQHEQSVRRVHLNVALSCCVSGGSREAVNEQLELSGLETRLKAPVLAAEAQVRILLEARTKDLL